MARHKGSKDYPEWVKRKAIQMYMEEKLPPRIINEQLGIRDDCRVRRWVVQYQRDGEFMLESRRQYGGRPSWSKEARSYISQLEKENEFLKKVRTELRQEWLAKRDIGSSKNTGRPTQWR